MCNPVILLAATAAISAAGQYQQGKAAAQKGEYDAKVAEIKAQDAIERGDEDLARHRRQVAALKSRQVASAAAQGVDVSTGSAAGIIEDTLVMGELDAQVIKRNAEMQAQGFLSQGEMSLFEGNVGQISSNIGALSTLVGGASKAYSYA